MTGNENFEGATFVRTSFTGATFRSCDLSGVTIRSADVDGLDIDGPDLMFGSLVVNGVDVVPLVEILEVRAERQQMVTAFLATATPELLAEERDNPWGGGGDWHPTVGDCLRVILEEEWAHLRYVRRDLALLS